MKRTRVSKSMWVVVALLAVVGLACGAQQGPPQLYNVSLDIVGQGSVTVAPQPLGVSGTEATYTTDGSFYYSDPQGLGIDVLCEAEAAASPAPGWQFVRWELGRVGSETLPTSNPVHLLLVPGGGNPSNWTLRAVFVELYTIGVSADPTAGGTVSGGAVYADGAPVTVVASADNCYTFVNWTEGGFEVSTNATYTFTASVDRDLVAHFQLRTYTIAVSAAPTAGGTAEVTGGATHDCGTQVTVVATPNDCYTFVNWTEGETAVSTSASYSFAAANRTLVAHFVQTTYTIAVSAAPTAGGTAEVTDGATHNCGTQVTVVATPNDCYTFVNWTEGETAVSTSASYSFAAANRTLVAHFALTTYTINVSADPTAGGTATVTGGATHDCGTQVTVVAEPNNCYTFVNWTEGETAVSTSASYSFAAANRTLVAHFVQTTYTTAVSADPTAGGTAAVTGGATHDCGTQVTVTATPSSGYEFVNWTEGATAVSTSASYSFTAAGNRTLVAHFRLIPSPSLFFDQMEAGKNGWTVSTTNWAQVTASCCPNMPSPTHAWGFGKNGSFTGKGILTSPRVSVAGQTQVTVEFWYGLQLSAPKSYLNATVQIQLGQGSWKTIWTSAGAARGAWTHVGPIAVNITARTTTVRLRVNVTGSKYAGCFTIDDVKVSTPGGARAASDEFDVQEAQAAFSIESVENYPNPIRDVHTTTFSVKGVGIEEICVNIYDQTGLLVFTSGWQPNDYDWHVESNDGETLANGVYLYTVVVRGVTGEVVVTETRKLAVYR